MAIHAAEEETIEALKTWWNENGKRLVSIVIVVFAAYTGWLLWQNSKNDAAEASSNLYEEILTLAFSVEEGEQVSAEDGEQIIELADQLRTNHGDTAYARYGALYAAQQHVNKGDLGAAEASLRWILDNPLSGFFTEPDPGLELTATLRLGRLLLAQGNSEQALARSTASTRKISRRAMQNYGATFTCLSIVSLMPGMPISLLNKLALPVRRCA